MRVILIMGLLFFYCKTVGYAVVSNKEEKPNSNNVFIITLDGFRWQELFNGADKELINDQKFTAQPEELKKRFWHDEPEERRKLLMPFLWNVVASEGQLFGNRQYGSCVNVSNIYAISYPGYNEIFTGKTDITIATNKKRKNRNITLLEYLNNMQPFSGKVAAFTSWDAFPYILNSERSNLYVNCRDADGDKKIKAKYALNKLEEKEDSDQPTRNDLVTYLAARDYIKQKQPRVVHIGLSGTDDFAHERKYDQYLNQAHLADRIIGLLWQLVQSLPNYKNNTTFIITTDHGRGAKKNNWHEHGFFTKGSSQTWLALIGNGVKNLGENKQKIQLYQKQLAGTIGYFLNVSSYNNYSIPVTYFSSPHLKKK